MAVSEWEGGKEGLAGLGEGGGHVTLGRAWTLELKQKDSK